MNLKHLWRLIRGPRKTKPYIGRYGYMRFDNLVLEEGSPEYRALKRRALRRRAGLSEKCECGRVRCQ